MYSQVAQLLKILNSEASANQISMAIVLGLFVGFSPLMSLHCILIFLIACITRVNLTVFFLAATGFTLLGLLLSTLAVSLGEGLLLAPSLAGLWTELYQFDAMRLMRINHTLVLGSFVVAAVAAVPVFFLSRYLVDTYRHSIMDWVNSLRVVKLLKATNFFQDHLS